MRAKVWRARLTSPLFNCETYARNLQRVYSQMWKTYEQGNPPHHIMELE